MFTNTSSVEPSSQDAAEDSHTPIKSTAFVRMHYLPKDDHTRSRIGDLALNLGLDADDEAVVRCLSGIHMAARQAREKESRFISFPASANDYSGEEVGYRAAKRILDHLKTTGFLTKVFHPQEGTSTVYVAAIKDDEGLQFSTQARGRLIVKTAKPERSRSRPWEAPKAKPMSRRQAVATFGAKFTQAEERLRRLNEALSAHPLEAPNGDTYYVMDRIFNEGRMDRGGRLYGVYQNMKEAERLKFRIDGKPVCEIDLKASHLFIASALTGEPTMEKDPYARIGFVAQDANLRDLGKKLVVSIISQGGRLRRFPAGFKDEFGLHRRQTIDTYQDDIFGAFPALDRLPVTGLEVMYIESEIIMKTMEALIAMGIPSFAVHDCLICKEEDHLRVLTELQGQMVSELGCAAAMKISFHDGSIRAIEPLDHLSKVA